MDDILCISHEPSILLQSIRQIFKLKNGFGTPTTFLGMEMKEYEHVSGRKDIRCWGLGSADYVRRVVKEIEEKAYQFGFKFPTRQAVTPWHHGYDPSFDLSELINDEVVINWYQGMIGTLRWLVEIGRIDIAHAVSVLSSYSSVPRVGHIVECLHVFRFLKETYARSLILDPIDPVLEISTSSAEHEWKEFYPVAEENIPLNMPVPKGRSVMT